MGCDTQAKGTANAVPFAEQMPVVEHRVNLATGLPIRQNALLTTGFVSCILPIGYLTRWLTKSMPTSHLDATFAALADPTRRALLARLAKGEATVMELAKPFKISLPAVSKHLKVLERAGLIGRGRAAQWRPCRLQATPLREAADWVEEYRRFWEQSFDRLDDYLNEIQTKEKKHDHKK